MVLDVSIWSAFIVAIAIVVVSAIYVAIVKGDDD